MRRLHIAIVGFGRLGLACAEAARNDEQIVLAGVVRRPESPQILPAPFDRIRVVSHIRELSGLDAVLVCIPAEWVRGCVHDLLQLGLPVVECARFHGEAVLEHKQAIDRWAIRFERPAVVGAGWDPGALSLMRDLFALLTPKGHTDISHRPGISLHHTTLAGSVPGVKGALSTEHRNADGQMERYVYVELADGARLEEVKAAVAADPLFGGDITTVFQVESMAALEDEHGVLLQRHGSAGQTRHQYLMFEARLSEAALSAQMMLAAARALPGLKPRAYSLFDLPLGALWGELRKDSEQTFL
ncbi:MULTISPECIES: diaminopimelate dehydrogenase [Methylocaldum]|uniref:diaminopimelate dehydrogenase n=1 Tax=Methylocaldum sp. TaxID=1969727 RepID=UPI0012EC60B4|nr:diaminopimelate dehydrogenase [Methylocaldum sp. BRCS4]